MTTQQTTQPDEEIIDFSKAKDKIKGIFSSKTQESKAHGHHETQSGHDKGGSRAGTWSAFFKTHGKWMIPLFLLLLTISMSVYLRTMPMRMPMADDWAATTVENYYKSQISTKVAEQYPNLPDQNKNTLVNTEWQKFQTENWPMIESQRVAAATQFRSQFQDDSGVMYILGIDPYHYFRLVSNVVDHGYQGTSFKDGVAWDDYFLDPEGRYAGSDFHAYFGAFLYKFLNFFATVAPMTSFFLIGTIFSALSVIPAFFIGRKISGNNVGGFYAALLVAVSSFYVARTTGETSDTDVYTVFFPLLITWFLIEAYDIKRSRIWMIVLAALAGLATGLFSMAWIGGWWYIFLFLILATLGSVGIKLIEYRKQLKEKWQSLVTAPGILLATYVISTGLFVSLLSSFTDFINAVKGPMSFINIKSVATVSLWPNIRTTVAELNVPPFSTVVSELGGTLLLVIAIGGIILSLRKREDGSRHYMIALLLAMWLVSSLFATTKGVRFILQVIPAFSLGVGIAVGVIWMFLSEKAHTTMKINKTLAMAIIFLGFSLLFIAPAQAGYKQAYGSLPAMNDQWYNTLHKIDVEGDTKAVINSWWDFGHWFKAIGNRPVTFDGAAQVGYDAYWVGHALYVSDEKQSTGILRMLNCGQNKAFETFDSFLNDTHFEVETLNQIVAMNVSAAHTRLMEVGLSSVQADEVLKYTHCAAPTDYFITSEDMIGKAGVWGHFGGWDFKRAEMYQRASKLNQKDAVALLQRDYNVSETDATQYYQEMQTTTADNWIAVWPSYLSGLSGCTKNGEMLDCPMSLQQGRLDMKINLSSGDATVLSQDGKTFAPRVLVYANKDGIVEKKTDGNVFNFGVILLPTGDGQYGVILADPNLATSVFTKLFFFEGHGLSCFTNFDRVRQFSGGKISTWTVDYSCTQPKNQVFFVPIEKVEAAHILIAFDKHPEAEALSLATKIRSELNADNFAEYAKKYSEDPGSAPSGGELGKFERGTMVKEFENAAFALNKGDISELVRSQFGYHIILLKDKISE